MKNWNIKEIEAINEQEAANMAQLHLTIKEHDIYIVDFGGYFKYSCLVFRNGAHLYYADDFELHHTGKTHEELLAMYREAMEKKLFTDRELGDDLTDYNQYKAKENYLRNYWGMQKPYVSAFCIGDDKEHKKHERATKGKIYDPVNFAYYDDKDFVQKHVQLFADLELAKDRMIDNPEYWRRAFVYEMWNHEYAINWDADVDTLSAFGYIPHKRGEWTLQELFNELNFNDIQRQAYFDARAEYYAQCQ